MYYNCVVIFWTLLVVVTVPLSYMVLVCLDCMKFFCSYGVWCCQSIMYGLGLTHTGVIDDVCRYCKLIKTLIGCSVSLKSAVVCMFWQRLVLSVLLSGCLCFVDQHSGDLEPRGPGCAVERRWDLLKQTDCKTHLHGAAQVFWGSPGH